MRIFIIILFAFAFFTSKAQGDTALLNKSFKIIGADVNRNSVSSGTGFFINYKQRYFLVTNYHVMTGKLPDTRKKGTDLRDTCDIIVLTFRSTQNDTILQKRSFRLYKENIRQYSLYHYTGDTLLDIAVMPFDKKNFPSQRDTGFAIKVFDSIPGTIGGLPLYIVGFPMGNFVNGWQPTISKANSIGFNPPNGLWIPLIFFNKHSEHGESGSPIYVKNNKTNQFILVGVNSMGFPSGQPQGVGINIREVIRLINAMIYQNRPDVDLF